MGRLGDEYGVITLQKKKLATKVPAGVVQTCYIQSATREVKAPSLRYREGTRQGEEVKAPLPTPENGDANATERGTAPCNLVPTFLDFG